MRLRSKIWTILLIAGSCLLLPGIIIGGYCVIHLVQLLAQVGGSCRTPPVDGIPACPPGTAEYIVGTVFGGIASIGGFVLVVVGLSGLFIQSRLNGRQLYSQPSPLQGMNDNVPQVMSYKENSSDTARQLEQLAQLHKDGQLTGAEFEAAKAKILGYS